MKSSLKNKINIILKSAIIFLLVVILESQTNNVVLNVQNSNLNRQLDLNTFAVIDINNVGYDESTMAYMIDNKQKTEQEEPNEVNLNKKDVPTLNTPLATYTGKMTGYVHNCPKCSGKLACDASLDLSNGKTTYYDAMYGDINIVAASKNLSCGTIVSIKSKISTEPIVAIVLDRGVSGTTLDLLSESVEYARRNIGRTDITYDVLRQGY